MTSSADGPTSEQIRQRALRYIDPRGRPSLPGPSSLELAVEEQRMRDERSPGERHSAMCAALGMDEVEGYGRDEVEPALGLVPKGVFSRTLEEGEKLNGHHGGFEHWKLDGEGVTNAVGDLTAPSEHRIPVTREVRNCSPSPSPSSFSAKTTICGIDFEVERIGKHWNLRLILADENTIHSWTFEPLETAIPKLEAILGAARLANGESDCPYPESWKDL